ncbi:hypothetical protein EV658_1093 [Phaeovulum veldkampii DSM 11550]|nr:hypothetical protein EV658_1093 [Phaeovulum veldkampii DSM 11550]
MATAHPALTNESTTADITNYLKNARDDRELRIIVARLNREGKRALGQDFSIRFDETIMSKDFRNRVFVSLC